MIDANAAIVLKGDAAPNPELPQASALIVAAGRSARMQGVDKLFVELDGQPLLYHTLAAFEACDHINHVTLVLSLEAAEQALALLKQFDLQKVDATCLGGERRQDSVRAGIDATRACEWIVVHDAARPLVTPALIRDGIEAAQQTGAASAGLPVVDTLKEVASDNSVLWTVPREHLWAVQTPQVFRLDLLRQAHEQGEADATDDAALIERLGTVVRLYAGSLWNLKVTVPEDVAVAEVLLRLRRGEQPAPRSERLRARTTAAARRPGSRTSPEHQSAG